MAIIKEEKINNGSYGNFKSGATIYLEKYREDSYEVMIGNIHGRHRQRFSRHDNLVEAIESYKKAKMLVEA